MAGTEAEPADGPGALSAEPDRRVLEALVCPLTKAPLVFRRDLNELWSEKANLAFPIREGVPLLTADAARPLTDEDLLRR